MTGPIAALVTDALACVEREHRHAYGEMLQAIGDRCFDLEIDDEHFLIALREDAHGAVQSVVTDVGTLSAMIRGELDVIDAILADRLEITGAPDDLVAVAQCLTRFVQGAVRCVSMEPLLDRLEQLRKEAR